MEQQVIATFYEAFKKLDYQTMGSCYHSESTFEDPVFGQLNHEETVAMWQMLCERADQFQLTYEIDPPVTCRWKASYQFSKTKRRVDNEITSRFEFKEGKIYRQVDSFSLWKWSRQALGTIGLLLGWFGPFQTQIKEQAVSGLHRYMQKE